MKTNAVRQKYCLTQRRKDAKIEEEYEYLWNRR